MAKISQRVKIIDFTWMAAASALSCQWIVIHTLHIPLPSPWNALLPGLGIFGAAFLLSWAAELAQLEIPQSIAFLFLALVAVLPEYAVDMYFAWMAGKEPRYVHFALANMTGANRLLIGLGWPVVLLAYWAKSRKTSIRLDQPRTVEISALLLATLYSFILPLKGSLSTMDSLVFFGIFTLYVLRASRAQIVEPELEGPTEIISRWPRGWRRTVTLALFGLSGYTIFAAAHPFAEGLLATGRSFGIEEFILVQWLAPLASESPEFIVAIIFALKTMPGSALGTLVSSKVNQWTLLVGMIPLAFSLSLGRPGSMELDHRQTQEIFLTSAQSLFAVAIISNLSFSLVEGLLLLVLFAVQLFFPSAEVRYAFGAAYCALAVGIMFFSPTQRGGLRTLVLEILDFVLGKNR